MTWHGKLVLAAMALVVAQGPTWAVDKKIPDDAKTVLEKGDTFELVSLEPKLQKEKPKDSLHGWKILGKTAIKDKEVRQQILAALDKGITESKGDVARCFLPRHAVRGVHEGKTVELLICYECHRIHSFVNGEEKLLLPTAGSSEKLLDKT